MYAHELGLLIVVALPVLIIVGLQVGLFIAGERGTLLLPTSRMLPAVEADTPEGEQNIGAAAEPEVAHEELKKAA